MLLRGLPGPVLRAGARLFLVVGEPSNNGLGANCRMLGVPAGLGDVGSSIPVGAATEREGDIAMVASRRDEVAVVVNFILMGVDNN